MNTVIAEQKLIVWKCMIVGSVVGALLPLGAFVLAQIGGPQAYLTLRIAVLVFWPILYISGALQDPTQQISAPLLMFGGVGFYMAFGWLIGVIAGCFIIHKKSRKAEIGKSI
jgi:hypothetical protein